MGFQEETLSKKVYLWHEKISLQNLTNEAPRLGLGNQLHFKLRANVHDQQQAARNTSNLGKYADT